MAETEIDIKALAAELARVSKQSAKLQAVLDIQNLMARYEYIHYPERYADVPALFALKQPDVSMDLSNGGIFVGKDAIEFVWNGVLGGCTGIEPGEFMNHTLTTQAIEVAGDLKTAKALWMSPGHETFYPNHSRDPPPGAVKGKSPMAAYWCWGKYACDFIVEDGVWKIWHMKWIRDFRCDYYKSWVDDVEMEAKQSQYPNFGRTDVHPVRYHEPYNPQVNQYCPVNVTEQKLTPCFFRFEERSFLLCQSPTKHSMIRTGFMRAIRN